MKVTAPQHERNVEQQQSQRRRAVAHRQESAAAPPDRSFQSRCACALAQQTCWRDCIDGAADGANGAM
eukprot:11179938-Lingulodinium_polyedra.AAC.3